MMPRLLLSIACVMLAGVAVLPWLRDPMATDLAVRTETSTEQAQPDFNLPAPLDANPDVIRRPIFVASRRLPEAEAIAGAPGETLLLERYPVIGVVVAGDRRLVLIRKAAGDTVSRLEQGAQLDGWTLTEVSRTRLVLEKDGARKEVILRNNGGSAD